MVDGVMKVEHAEKSKRNLDRTDASPSFYTAAAQRARSHCKLRMLSSSVAVRSLLALT